MSTNDKTEVFEANINLIRYILNKRWSQYAHDEDVFQECCLACWKSLDKYDNSYKLSTWWTQVIDSTCMTLYRRNHAIRRTATMCSLSDFAEPSLQLTIADYVVGRQDVDADFTDEYIAVLTPRQRYIVDRRLSGFTQQEIADELGITQATVSRELRRMQTIASCWLQGCL